MGYYMRFIVTDPREVSLAILEAALKRVDPAYWFDGVEVEPTEAGVLMRGDEVYGEIQVNRPGDGLFDDEIGVLQESVAEARGWRKRPVAKALASARAIVAVRVLDQGRSVEANLSAIDPLWACLFANRAGLLQADDEGYYDRRGKLILKVR